MANKRGPADKRGHNPVNGAPGLILGWLLLVAFVWWAVPKGLLIAAVIGAPVLLIVLYLIHSVSDRAKYGRW